MGITSCAAWCVRRRGFANRIPFRCGAQSINRTEREKSMPARIAAIRGHAQHSEKPPEFTLFYQLLGNALQFEVSASRATCVPEKCNGCRSPIKPALALHTSPRTQCRNRHQPVANSATVRSQAAFVPARWANHPVVRLFSRRRIHKPLLNFNSSSVLIPRY